MVSLLDITPATGAVRVRGGELTVRGISAEAIAQLVGRFPELGGALTGAGVQLDAQAIIALVPRAVSVIIAAGCGHVNDPEAEAAAGNLTAEEQADAVSTIVALTMPNGIGPFVQKLTALGGALEPGANRGKGRASR
jgi:hypothetical protein